MKIKTVVNMGLKIDKLFLSLQNVPSRYSVSSGLCETQLEDV